MKIQMIGIPKVVMENPMSKHNYFAWPTVARLKDGKVALAASGYRLAHICPFGKAVMAVSENEGKTYSAPFPVIDTVLDDRDAGLCPFGESGLIVTSFNNTVEFQRKSGKGGCYKESYLDTVTSDEEAEVLGSTFRVSFDNGVTFGPLYRSPVTCPHGPVELPDGRIVYVGRNFDRTCGDGIFSYGINPEDGTCTYLGAIKNIADEKGSLLSCEPHTVALSDGTLICHIRVERSLGGFRYEIFTTYQTLSRDGGRTWTDPEPIADSHGGAPAHLLRHSSGVLISVAARRNEPWGIVAYFSQDDGRTWSDARFLYEDSASADCGYPATVELADGTLQTVFYAHPGKDTPAVILAQNWKMEE